MTCQSDGSLGFILRVLTEPPAGAPAARPAAPAAPAIPAALDGCGSRRARKRARQIRTKPAAETPTKDTKLNLRQRLSLSLQYTCNACSLILTKPAALYTN